jgi:adenosylmethionine-8-amino-7-oxononanoate aminotransferase
MFTGILPKHFFAESPSCKYGEKFDSTCMKNVENILKKESDNIAAVIIEPIVQGAGGMKFYHPEFLRQLKTLCEKYSVLLILDEIATGFGRTGKLFGANHAEITPDIMCVGKALTGGYMTLSATMCTEKIAQGISEGGGVFMHGPTFMANPMACSVAAESLRLVKEYDIPKVTGKIEKTLKEILFKAKSLPTVENIRVLGAIGVMEMKGDIDVCEAQRLLIDKGVWLRPFGRLLYTMPPFVVSDNELENIANAMVGFARQA